MRRPHIRFTTRRLMILIAAIAMTMGAGRAAGRCWCCWKTAEDYACRREMLTIQICGVVPWTAEQIRVRAERDGKLSEYYSRKETKYRRAAWRFWEPAPELNPFDDLDEQLKVLDSLLAPDHQPGSKVDGPFEYFDYGATDLRNPFH